MKKVLGAAILASAFLYKDSFSAYFFQDDWFSLRISSISSLSGFLAFFIPRTDVIYYRPIGMQVPFFLLQSLFGLQPVAFHWFTFLFHALNIILVFLLLRSLKLTDRWAACGAFLYGTSTVHYLPLIWTATVAFTIGPTFVLASFLTFIRFLSTENRRWYVWSILFFILALSSYELAVVLPVVLGLYGWYQREAVRKILLLIPYVVCAVAIFFIRFVLYPPPLSGAYQQGIGIATIKNLKGYLLWSLQWPEEITAQFVSFFHLNSQFSREFHSFLLTETVTSLLLAVLLLIAGSIYLQRQGITRSLRVWLFTGAWFIVGIGPIIFFVGHSFSYYLPVSLVALLYGGMFLLQESCTLLKWQNRQWGVIAFVIALWFIAGVNTMQFNAAIHWAPRRANNSRMLVQKAARFYPPAKLQEKAIIYVRPSSENKLSLNNQDAFLLLYPHLMVKTIYGYVIDHEVL